MSSAMPSKKLAKARASSAVPRGRKMLRGSLTTSSSSAHAVFRFVRM
jgi:hypothetical protein